MSPGLLAAMRKELLSFLRDPDSRRVLLGMPLMQILVFTFAATLEVTNVDIAVANNDSGRWSQEFQARVAASGFVAQSLNVDTVAQVAELVTRREVLLGLHFAPDFSRRLAAGEPAPVQVIVDGRRANGGQVALGYLEQIAAQLGIELRWLAGEDALAPTVAVRHWFNPNLEYRWFIVVIMIGAMVMMLVLMMTSLSIARERELGTFDQLLVTPISPLEIILSKMIPALFVGFVVGHLVLGLAIYVFAVPFSGNYLLLQGCTTIFLLSVVGVGLTISSVCETQQQAILGTFFGVMPFMLTSGFATPVENMPQWLQYASDINPLKHFLFILQGIYLRGMGVADVIPRLLPLVLIAGFTLTLATTVVRRRLH